MMQGETTIRVRLIKYTVDGDRLIAAAAQQSLSRSPVFKHLDPSKWGEEKVRRWIRELLKRGHLSPLEHSVYTFYVEGISRVCSHQLVRHRIASYTQFSQRWKRTPPEFVVPPTISRRTELLKEYTEFIESAYRLYSSMIDRGVPPEDARYVLPQSVTTKIVMTVNARELLHIVSLRACTRAQWELRFVAWRMLDEAHKVHPTIFEESGPRCVLMGKCPEGVPSDKIWKCISAGLRVLLDLGERETYKRLHNRLKAVVEGKGAGVE